MEGAGKLFPSPLWGGARGGGREVGRMRRRFAPPHDPHPTLPHKGGGKLSWLALEPQTGRTHQLRVHCAEMGWPILGDAIYGTAPRNGGPGLQLHAREIVVPL